MTCPAQEGNKINCKTRKETEGTEGSMQFNASYSPVGMGESQEIIGNPGVIARKLGTL